MEEIGNRDRRRFFGTGIAAVGYGAAAVAAAKTPAALGDTSDIQAKIVGPPPPPPTPSSAQPAPTKGSCDPRTQPLCREIFGPATSLETPYREEISCEDPLPSPELDALSSKFKRTGLESAAWNDLLAQIDEDLKITTDGTLVGKLGLVSQRIELGFQRTPSAFHAVPYMHVEPLLDQAADLLDRGIRERSVWDQTAAEALESILEMREFVELDKIHVEEEQAGLYDTSWKESNSNFWAFSYESSANMRTAEQQSEYASDLFHAYQHPRRYRAMMQAWLSPMPLSGDLDKSTYRKYTTSDGEVGTLPEQLVRLAGDAALDEIGRDYRVASSDSRQGYAAANAAAARKCGIGMRALWEKKNAGFARRRALVSRGSHELRAKALLDGDGVLNRAKRLGAIRTRFFADFNEALARLEVVRTGLRVIYGYDDPFPTNPKSINYFDECLAWTRRAVEWLVRFARTEQSTIYSISIRHLLGEPGWASCVAANEWRFRLEPSDFSTNRHLRIRGLSLTCELAGSTPQSGAFVITIPRAATSIHLDDSIHSLDQREIPVVRVGRVFSRSSPRESDVQGSSMLHNCSPLGEWLIQRPTTRLQPDSAVQDITLDVVLAYREVGTKSFAIRRL
jgi:hypothetical protein